MDTGLFETSRDFALEMDQQDPLAAYRQEFYFPKHEANKEALYFCGNSLGLQSKGVANQLQQELKDWQQLGVEGHFHAKNAWLPYHEFFSKKLSKIVGAKEKEVVVMNTLTTNLHLMMVSFYRPTKQRFKIVIEKAAFPSDKYAVASQLRFHGYDTKDGLIELTPREGEETLRQEDIETVLRDNGEQIALVLLGGVNYYTGQFFNLQQITSVGHEIGAIVGFDLAHAAGNVPMSLHDWNVDFAVWCHYKYLNAGPGAIAGAFVHERHLEDPNMPRFEGWWGHDKSRRFLMEDTFAPMPTAEAWQLSNAPVFSMAPLLASLELFDKIGMDQLRRKSIFLTAYLEFLVHRTGTDRVRVITPTDQNDRGCQLSIQVKNSNKALYETLTKKGVIADWREPDVIRVAPVPMYNSFADVYDFARLLKDNL